MLAPCPASSKAQVVVPAPLARAVMRPSATLNDIIARVGEGAGVS